MLRKYRTRIQLVVAAAVLFLQVTLAYHHHDPQDHVQCESSCQLNVESPVSHHDADSDESCAYTLFYLNNHAGDPLASVSTLPEPEFFTFIADDTTAHYSQTTQTSFNSRAPPRFS